jgi:quercetin dioxygenase-like cupin family protein
MKRVCFSFIPVLCLAIVALAVADPATRHPKERDGSAAVIHRSDVIRNADAAGSAPMRLWPLYSSPESRMNYVQVAGRSPMHLHPDADHKLYVLEGRVTVVAGTNTSIASAGDLIIIPQGVRHCYDVPAKGERALLLTFDAPPYDPRQTVQLETTKETK